VAIHKVRLYIHRVVSSIVLSQRMAFELGSMGSRNVRVVVNELNQGQFLPAIASSMPVQLTGYSV
jgi:hypothetical protein